ncbi:MAG: hypothetical protein KDG44_03315 [Burkholderiaceae bacterium]|nr:hypothetical protein [Burkholderiaceae bacterium]
MAAIDIKVFEPTATPGVYQHRVLGRMRVSVPLEVLAGRLADEHFTEVAPNEYTHPDIRCRFCVRPGQTVSDLLAEVPPEPAPPRARVPKSVVLSRLTDAQLEAALALMTPRQMERWRAPDQPTVYTDDPDTVAIVTAVGADPQVVLAV